MSTVTIWHNTAQGRDGQPIAMLLGYGDGDRLVPVALYPVDDGATTSDAQALAEQAYRLFNVGDDPDFGTPDERALQYRARGNRSLSIGDVVQVDSTWLAVEAVGFRRLGAPPAGLDHDGAPQHGSTPITLPGH